MTSGANFDFGASSVAQAYDDVLVPLMFEPWAKSLLAAHPGWSGLSVLDLATGTGIVASLVAQRVGPEGRVIGADLNPEMLELARKRCAGTEPAVEFKTSPAHPLDLPDQSVDVVLCQQAFQFFPDRVAAAQEIRRVLRPGGRVLASAWLPVSECKFFGWICEALEEIGEAEISTMMRLPFDHLPTQEFVAPFETAGFQEVRLRRQTAAMIMPEGPEQAVGAAYATPIGPKLRNLPEQQRNAFDEGLRRRAKAASSNGATVSPLVASILSAITPAD